jgi:N-acetylmuramoyl-L-alanine amidase
MSPRRIVCAVVLIALSGPGAASAREHGTPRQPNSITAIVIHAVGGPACVAGAVRFVPDINDTAYWDRYLRQSPTTDAHYVIGRSGDRLQVIPELEIANHTEGLNEISIGIELVNRGDGIDPFADAQIAKLIETILDLRRRYQIPLENIVAHSDMDQRTCVCAGVPYRRRQDPGPKFPMERVLKEVRLSAAETAGQFSLPPPLTGPAPADRCGPPPR